MNLEEQKRSTENEANTVAHLNRGKDYFGAGDYATSHNEAVELIVFWTRIFHPTGFYNSAADLLAVSPLRRPAHRVFRQ
jgi:hypothetical protein